MFKFKKGDRVYLLPTSPWADGTAHNPIDTVGTVLDYDCGKYSVMWGGHIKNGEYTNTCLILEEHNPTAGLHRIYESSPDYINYEVNDE